MFSNTKKSKDTFDLNEAKHHINDKNLFNFFEYVDNNINEQDKEIDCETDEQYYKIYNEIFENRKIKRETQIKLESYWIINYRKDDYKKKYYDKNDDDTTHFITSSEYIKKVKDKDLHMTKSHGLGSGLYGLVILKNNKKGIEKNIDNVDEVYKIQSKKIFEISKPLIIFNNYEDSYITTISIWLIEICESIIKKEDKTFLKLCKQYKNIQDLKKYFKITNDLYNVINSFITDWKNENTNYLKQPINYLLEPQYNGIFNKSNNGNKFNRGSISFIDVNPRKQPKGDEVIFIDKKENLIFKGHKINL